MIRLTIFAVLLLSYGARSFTYIHVSKSHNNPLVHVERVHNRRGFAAFPPILVLCAAPDSEEEKDTNPALEETESTSMAMSVPPPATAAKSNRDADGNNPLIQGEVTMDGSVLVLAPAAVIAVVGFIMSVNIALNSQDEIVSALNSVEIKPRNEQSVPLGVCRGLCSTQETDLNHMRSFMRGLTGMKSDQVIVDESAVSPSGATSSVERDATESSVIAAD